MVMGIKSNTQFIKIFGIGFIVAACVGCNKVSFAPDQVSLQESMGAQQDCSQGNCNESTPKPIAVTPPPAPQPTPVVVTPTPTPAPAPAPSPAPAPVYTPGTCDKITATQFDAFPVTGSSGAYFAQDVHGNRIVQAPQINNLLNFSGQIKVISSLIMNIQNGTGVVFAQTQVLGQMLDLRADACVQAEVVTTIQNIDGDLEVVGTLTNARVEVDTIKDVKGRLRLVNVHLKSLVAQGGPIELINSVIDTKQ